MSSTTHEKIMFRVKKTTKFAKIMEIYCNRSGIARRQVRFLFDGQVIKETDTPESLGVEDDDQIDAAIEQVGGCSL